MKLTRSVLLLSLSNFASAGVNDVPSSLAQVVDRFRNKELSQGANFIRTKFPVPGNPESYVFSEDKKHRPRRILFMVAKSSDRVCQILFDKVAFNGLIFKDWVESFDVKSHQGGDGREYFQCSCKLNRLLAPHELQLPEATKDWNRLEVEFTEYRIQVPGLSQWLAECPTNYRVVEISDKVYCEEEQYDEQLNVGDREVGIEPEKKKTGLKKKFATMKHKLTGEASRSRSVTPNVGVISVVLTSV